MRFPLHVRILVGAVVGIVCGIAAHLIWRDSESLATFIRYVSQPAGQIFIRLLLMLVVPLIFAALVLGVAGLGDMRSLGRVGLKTFAYTVTVSLIAVVLAFVLVDWIRPGEGMSDQMRERLLAGAQERAAAVTAAPPIKSGVDLIVQIVPDNPIKAAANGDMLAVMFFSLLVGIGVAFTRTDAARRFEEAVQGLYDISQRLIHLVISAAPFGVAALLFTLTAQLGYDILFQLARYIGVVLLGLAIQQFVVYSIAVRALGGMSPLRFFKKIQAAMLTAFSTSSSNATLPTALQVAEEELKLPSRISRFVLTIGATANQNGTALFEGVTVLFLAQFYGVDLAAREQMLVLAICTLAGIGTAGVPSGSIPVIAAILALINVPVEGLGLILGVDRFLDMCRTVINVSGDLSAAVVVARREGWRDEPALDRPV